MSTPLVRGWCPGAHRPMMSGDGLVMRIRPYRSELTSAQVLGLCDIAEAYGNGVLDLTSRANLQIRGVLQDAFDNVLNGLDDLNLLDPNAELEGRRNILMPHTWMAGDLTDRLYQALLETLPLLPSLPLKMGFALDTSAEACLNAGSADFRFERDLEGHLLLRADGCARGRGVSEANAMDALHELVGWFVSSEGPKSRRMARHLSHTSLPAEWQDVEPRPEMGEPVIGLCDQGMILGAPFGKVRAEDLRALTKDSGATWIRLMLGRLFLINGEPVHEARAFATVPSRLMQVHACPGAPFCPQATVETLQVARNQARKTHGTLHVSGCSKGCAYPKSAATTLVGRDGRFDLVTDGQPWDDPRQRGLDPATLMNVSSSL